MSAQTSFTVEYRLAVDGEVGDVRGLLDSLASQDDIDSTEAIHGIGRDSGTVGPSSTPLEVRLESGECGGRVEIGDMLEERSSDNGLRRHNTSVVTHHSRQLGGRVDENRHNSKSLAVSRPCIRARWRGGHVEVDEDGILELFGVGSSVDHPVVIGCIAVREMSGPLSETRALSNASVRVVHLVDNCCHVGLKRSSIGVHPPVGNFRVSVTELGSTADVG